jgi:predicted ribosomally synthesized peptide with nif11-like leader
MSIENAQKFRSVVAGSPALAKQILAAKNRDEFLAAAVKLGAENGLQFTTEEAVQVMDAAEQATKGGELSDSQLEGVAGGKGKGGPMTIEDTVCMKLFGWCP